MVKRKLGKEGALSMYSRTALLQLHERNVKRNVGRIFSRPGGQPTFLVCVGCVGHEHENACPITLSGESLNVGSHSIRPGLGTYSDKPISSAPGMCPEFLVLFQIAKKRDTRLSTRHLSHRQDTAPTQNQISTVSGHTLSNSPKQPHRPIQPCLTRATMSMSAGM